MIEDEVLRRVWATKEALAGRFNYDIKALGDYPRERQRQSGRSVVRLMPRRPEGWMGPVTSQPSEPKS